MNSFQLAHKRKYTTVKHKHNSLKCRVICTFKKNRRLKNRIWIRITQLICQRLILSAILSNHMMHISASSPPTPQAVNCTALFPNLFGVSHNSILYHAQTTQFFIQPKSYTALALHPQPSELPISCIR